MNMKRMLVASVLITLFLVPIVTSTAPLFWKDQKTPAQVTDFQRVGTIEAIVTEIDPDGGVRNAVSTFQNASYYGYGYVDNYQALVESQVATSNGFVSLCQLEVANRTVFPNGRIGSPAASLTLMVNPIVVVPANASELYITQPSLSEVFVLADEMVSIYETDLGIDFHRLTTVMQPMYLNYYVNENASINEYRDFYFIEYVSLLNAVDGTSSLSYLRDRLESLGGFMDLLSGDDWPMSTTTLAETLLFDHHSNSGYPSDFMNPYLMFNNVFRPYARVDATHADKVERFNTAVLGIAGFDIPEYIADGVGQESYSLKEHVGFAGDIESKMFQEMLATSMSTVVAITPSILEVDGMPEEWEYIDKDFTLNVSSPIYLPTGQTIPGNSTIDEILEAMLVGFPRTYAYGLNQSITYGVYPEMFDSWIDSIWGSAGPFPDMREYFLEFDWSMLAPTAPLQELNQDLLRAIMEEAGINPEGLMTNVNDTLLEDNPMQAIIEAFIDYFDSYNLLDILKNDTYVNPYILEGFLNDYISDIETFLAEFAGIDLPSSYETKEAFAALIEDHFGLVLQGLWDAMADFIGDTSNIKTAVQAMLNPTHLINESVPYLMADLYSSVATEHDYCMYLNFDMPVYTGGPYTYDPIMLWLSTEDIVLNFDLDVESINYVGPHLTIDKDLGARLVEVDDDIEVTITVKNIGTAPAFDLKILDGITSGFESDKRYYWNRAELNTDESWIVTFNITTDELGKYAEVPAILCYFNKSLNTFDASDLVAWGGSAMYTASTMGREVLIVDEIILPTTPTPTTPGPTTPDGTPTQWWEGNVLGIPIVIWIAGISGIVIVAVIIVVRGRQR